MVTTRRIIGCSVPRAWVCRRTRSTNRVLRMVRRIIVHRSEAWRTSCFFLTRSTVQPIIIVSNKLCRFVICVGSRPRRAQRLVECCVVEYSFHVRNSAHVPTSNILVERRVFEHIVHHCDLAHVPTTDILVEFRVVEHSRHRCHAAHVPSPNIFVEIGIVKHSMHIVDLVHVPARNILPKRRDTVKHRLHIYDVAHVPSPNIFVKVGFQKEQIPHIRDLADVPVLYRVADRITVIPIASIWYA